MVPDLDQICIYNLSLSTLIMFFPWEVLREMCHAFTVISSAFFFNFFYLAVGVLTDKIPSSLFLSYHSQVVTLTNCHEASKKVTSQLLDCTLQRCYRQNERQHHDFHYTTTAPLKKQNFVNLQNHLH